MRNLRHSILIALIAFAGGFVTGKALTHSRLALDACTLPGWEVTGLEYWQRHAIEDWCEREFGE